MVISPEELEIRPPHQRKCGENIVCRVIVEEGPDGALGALETGDYQGTGVNANGTLSAQFTLSAPTSIKLVTYASEAQATTGFGFWSNSGEQEVYTDLRIWQLSGETGRYGPAFRFVEVFVNQDGGVIVPMFASYVFATSNAIDHGGEFGSNWDMDGERWAERWSFSKVQVIPTVRILTFTRRPLTMTMTAI